MDVTRQHVYSMWAMKKDNDRQHYVEIFCQVSASKESTIDPGGDALVIAYRGTHEENLDKLGYCQFSHMITKNTITVDLGFLLQLLQNYIQCMHTTKKKVFFYSLLNGARGWAVN